MGGGFANAGGGTIYIGKDDDGNIVGVDNSKKKLDLNERQIKAVLYVKENGKISNSEYQELFNVSRATITRDLLILVDKDLLVSSGIKGAGSYYQLIIASIAS